MGAAHISGNEQQHDQPMTRDEVADATAARHAPEPARQPDATAFEHTETTPVDTQHTHTQQ